MLRPGTMDDGVPGGTAYTAGSRPPPTPRPPSPAPPSSLVTEWLEAHQVTATGLTAAVASVGYIFTYFVRCKDYPVSPAPRSPNATYMTRSFCLTASPTSNPVAFGTRAHRPSPQSPRKPRPWHVGVISSRATRCRGDAYFACRPFGAVVSRDHLLTPGRKTFRSPARTVHTTPLSASPPPQILCLSYQTSTTNCMG